MEYIDEKEERLYCECDQGHHPKELVGFGGCNEKGGGEDGIFACVANRGRGGWGTARESQFLAGVSTPPYALFDEKCLEHNERIQIQFEK